jgi:ERCC4-type nuclease
MLLVDDREPLRIVEMIAQNCSIPIDFRRLKTGDYISDDMEVGIERKQIKDFASSLISKKKRLWKQFDRLKKEFKHPFILISGKLSDLDMNVSNHAILGAIAYLATNGITVVKVDSDEDLAYLILKVFERYGKLKMPNELHNI